MTDPAEADVRASRAHAYENTRPDVRVLVPGSARRVLDVGCSSGALGAALKRERVGIEVVGVEVDPVYAARAAERLDRVVPVDLEAVVDEGVLDDLGRFDCVVAADVLEHLRDPWSVLAALVGLLADGGTAIVSLPNVRFWETFHQLGRHATWPLRDEGIFDRTHLRWFALSDAWALLEGAGLRVESVDANYRLRPWTSPADRYAELLGRTPLRGFFAYQYLLTGVRQT